MARTDRPVPNLLADARAERAGNSGPDCHLGEALAAHPDLAADILAVIGDKHITHAAAARVFRRYNIHLTDTTIARHRADECQKCKRAGRTW